MSSEYISNDLRVNTSKRCPIVMCLDVSLSMKFQNRIENLNKAVAALLNELEKDHKAKNCAEIAAVTFSTEVNVISGFELPGYWRGKTFKAADSGVTNMAPAVLKSLDMIKNRLEILEQEEIENYIPFMVLVTDGDPCNTDDHDEQEKALEAVRYHCTNSPLIAPFIVGVGNKVNEKLLDRYAEHFTRKAIIIDDDAGDMDFVQLFTFIGKSIADSLQGEGDIGGLYEKIRGQGRKEASRIETIRRERKHKKM